MLDELPSLPLDPRIRPPWAGLLGDPGQPFIDGRSDTDSRARECPALDVCILVVDDDDGVRESLTWLLEDAGYRVSSAGNGREALDLLARIPLPALALVDIRMPIMDGIQLIEALRGDPRYSAVPIIAFSAAVVSGSLPEVPLLKKPISVERLLSAIEAAISRRSS